MIKHKEVIQAWLDGKVIECKTSHGWLEWGGNEYAYSPITDIDMSWRIKPDRHTLTIPVYSNISNVNAYFDKETREIVIKYEEEAL